jgi:hypothetical protein
MDRSSPLTEVVKTSGQSQDLVARRRIRSNPPAQRVEPLNGAEVRLCTQRYDAWDRRAVAALRHTRSHRTSAPDSDPAALGGHDGRLPVRAGSANGHC